MKSPEGHCIHDMTAGHLRDDKFAAQGLPAEIPARVDVKLGTSVGDRHESFFQQFVLCEYAGGRVFRRIRAAAENHDFFVQG